MRSTEAAISHCVTSSTAVDVKHSLAILRVALVHCIHPQIARSAARIGSTALANGHGAGPRLLIVLALLAIARVSAQVVQMPVGDRGQALELCLAVLLKFPLQNAPRGRSAQALVGFIDPC